MVECANYTPLVKQEGKTIEFKRYNPKPTTNADRIRAMSDEELAEHLFAVRLGWDLWCDYHCENKGDDGCDKCILAWLKQPVKDGEDNGNL